MKTEYVLITPVHNEENFIESLIHSVTSQTILPKSWIIVDDNSTDRTSMIIKKHATQYPFIFYCQYKNISSDSYYSRRTKVVLNGYECIRNLDFSFVAFLDADITLKNDYYENILREFDRNPRLGIATGVYLENIEGHWRLFPRPDISTPGGLQMFRFECYESIGGYQPLKYGGDDTLAEIKARLEGWQTCSFKEYKSFHHRRMGIRNQNVMLSKFKQGLSEYNLGTHPLFMAAKSFRRLFLEKPYIVSSLARLLGFIYGSLHGGKREISEAAMLFVQKEQIKRLWSCFRV